jgi:hypothetical protein
MGYQFQSEQDDVSQELKLALLQHLRQAPTAEALEGLEILRAQGWRGALNWLPIPTSSGTFKCKMPYNEHDRTDQYKYVCADGHEICLDHALASNNCPHPHHTSAVRLQKVLA